MSSETENFEQEARSEDSPARVKIELPEENAPEIVLAPPGAQEKTVSKSRTLSTSKSEDLAEQKLLLLSYLGLTPKDEMAKEPVIRLPLPHVPKLNARGMPSRKRKPNSLLFDSDHVYDDHSAPAEFLTKQEMPADTEAAMSFKTPMKKLKIEPLYEEHATRNNWATVRQRLEAVTENGFGNGQRRSNDLLIKQEAIEPLRSPNNAARKNNAEPMQFKKTLLPLQQRKIAASSAAARLAAQRVLAKASASATGKSKTTKAGQQCKKLLRVAVKALPRDDLEQQVDLRKILNNVVDLVKCRRFMVAEHFYSYIDKHIFHNARDNFAYYAQSRYANPLKPMMTRVVWRSIRRQMGKPRRFSDAFLLAERRRLNIQRQQLRHFQKRQTADVMSMKTVSRLPLRVPLALPIATHVNALVHKPINCIYSGTIAAYDSVESSYLINFHKQELGAMTVADTAIATDSYNEVLLLPELPGVSRPRIYHWKPDDLSNAERRAGDPSVWTAAANETTKRLLELRSVLGSNNPQREGYERLANSARPTSSTKPCMTIYPPNMLRTMARLRASVDQQHHYVARIAQLNTELMKAPLVPWTTAKQTFERRRCFAAAVVALERVKVRNAKLLADLQQQSAGVIRAPWVPVYSTPNYIRESCHATADTMISSCILHKPQDFNAPAMLKQLGEQLLLVARADQAPNTAKELEQSMKVFSQNLQTKESVLFYEQVVQPRIRALFNYINRGISSGIRLTTPKADQTPPNSAASAQKNRCKVKSAPYNGSVDTIEIVDDDDETSIKLASEKLENNNNEIEDISPQSPKKSEPTDEYVVEILEDDDYGGDDDLVAYGDADDLIVYDDLGVGADEDEDADVDNYGANLSTQ